jgi:hypothetical protein
VPAIQDDRIFHVIRDTSDHHGDHGAECRFVTESQDWHLKLALRKERPLVGRIMAERQEFGKTRSQQGVARDIRGIVFEERVGSARKDHPNLFCFQQSVERSPNRCRINQLL